MTSLDKDPAHVVPHGLVIARSWLMEKKGIERHTLDNSIKSGRLVSVSHGVYKKPDTKLTWQGLVCSLQYMGYDLCPGGLTALELHGMGHYLSLSSQKTIHLYGLDTLPAWVNTILPDVTFIRQQQLFGGRLLVNHSYNGKDNLLTNGDPHHGKSLATPMPWGLDDWPMTISSAERALFEVLMDVPEKISFEHADQLMQGMASRSPRRLNTLLELCENIKVRRLLLWFAERHKHPWLDRLDREHFNMESHTLGSGKRVLFHGGKLDPKYLITVPPEMVNLGGMYGQE